jgi:signal transduction histidine kinase
LAAGIAHEINTPAQYVSDNVAFLSQGFKDVAPLLDACNALLQPHSNAAESLAAVRSAAAAADLPYLTAELPAALRQTSTGLEQITKIVRAMKEFAHPADEMKTIDVNRAIETTVTVARNEWKYVADVTLDLAPDLVGLPCHPSEISQVLLNLIVNAAHAIGDVVGTDGKTKGEIKISTRSVDDYVEIAVADTGCGIPQAIREKIYDPFFTTKKVGKGTGQGLAIVHRIVVRRHGGTVQCDSTVGKGTCFTIRLPVAGPSADAAPAASATSAVA